MGKYQDGYRSNKFIKNYTRNFHLQNPSIIIVQSSEMPKLNHKILAAAGITALEQCYLNSSRKEIVTMATVYSADNGHLHYRLNFDLDKNFITA